MLHTCRRPPRPLLTQKLGLDSFYSVSALKTPSVCVCVWCSASPLWSVGCGTRLGRGILLGCERGGGNLYCRRSEGNAAPNIPLASSAAATAAAALAVAVFKDFVHVLWVLGAEAKRWGPRRGPVQAAQGGSCRHGRAWVEAPRVWAVATRPTLALEQC